VLALPDLEHAKTAVLNSLTSISGQRTYEHAIREFVAWYCSEPRLAFNRTVVLRYRIHLEQRQYAPATINLRLAAVRRIAYEAADAGLLSPEVGCRHSPFASQHSDRIRGLVYLDGASDPTTPAYDPADAGSNNAAAPDQAGTAARPQLVRSVHATTRFASHLSRS
jgi:hypothetical protein